MLFKRLTVLLLIITVIGMKNPLTASAQTNPNFDINSKINEFLQIAALEPEEYGLYNVDLNNLEVSDPISPYSYTENGELEEIKDVNYYFICSNGQPVANVILCENDKLSVPSATFETETALKLSEFLKTNNEFTLIHNNNDLLILPLGNELVLSAIQPIDFTQNKVDGIIASSYPSSYSLNIPYVPQGNNGLCWAASVASVGKYKTNISKTAKEVADQMGVGYNEGANIYLASEALSNVFGIRSTAVSGYFRNISDIADVLLTGNPIIAGFSNSSSGHMVVISGYRASTQEAVLLIRDPNSSSTKMVSSGTDNYGNYTWLMSYYSDVGTMYWYESVFL